MSTTRPFLLLRRLNHYRPSCSQTRFYTTPLSSSSTSTATSDSILLVNDIPAPHTGNIRVLLMNRPKERNALNWALVRELRDKIEEVNAECGRGPTRALVIGTTEGSKGVFCAGADLIERKTFTPQQTAHFLSTLNATYTTLSLLPIPTLSAIPIHAHGGGLELALSTDFRITTTKAQLSLPETRLAILPGAGGTHRLPPVIGRTRALDMMLTGRRVGAQEALMWGLVDRVVEEGKSEVDGAVEMARVICEGGPLAIPACKGAVDGGLGRVRVEQISYKEVVDSKDKFEALDAFREKRKPVFKGE